MLPGYIQADQGIGVQVFILVLLISETGQGQGGDVPEKKIRGKTYCFPLIPYY